MDKKWIVYRHTSPSGKVYIGVTGRKCNVRWCKGKGYRLCKLFYRAISKYGWDNIKHEILFTNLTEQEAKDLEINLIRHYKRLGISYNITDGGDGMTGFKHSLETKQKLREACIGREHKSGWKWTEEQKANMPKRDIRGEKNPNYGNHKLAGKNHFMYGKNHTEETKKKISLANTGRTHKMPDRQKELLLKIHRKPVIQLDLNGNEILRFGSSIEAARYYGKGTPTANHIAECCKGKRNKCMNFKWIYDGQLCFNKSSIE